MANTVRMQTEVIRMFKAGRSFAQIGRDLGVSRNVIAGMIWRARKAGYDVARTTDQEEAA